MKRFHSLLLTAFTVAIICGSVSGMVNADEPAEKFGKGRLLRKWRDDLFGKSDEQKPDQPKAADPRQQPTPATEQQQPNVARMTPAQRQQYAQQQQARQQQLAANQSRQSAPSASRHAQSQSNAQLDAREARQSSGMVTEGFGMEVRRDTKDNFYVAQTIPNGNAAKAGVQRGDQILQVGGVKLTALEELEEITKILGGGDQLEFEVARRGQKKEILIQYGEAKNIDPNDLDAPGPGPRSASMPRQPGQQVTGRYDFVPPQTSNGLHSVLERPGLEPPSAQQVNGGRGVNRQVSQQRMVPQTEAQLIQQRLTLEQLEREIDQRRQMQLPSSEISPAGASRTVLE